MAPTGTAENRAKFRAFHASSTVSTLLPILSSALDLLVRFFSPPENLYLMLFQKRKKFIKILGLGEAICSARSSADALMRPMTC